MIMVTKQNFPDLGSFFNFFFNQGRMQMSIPPLQIMQSSFLHLGNQQGLDAECNG